MADTLRVMIHVDPPQNEPHTTNMIDNALATVVHASRCAVNHTMQTSPGAMVFNRDMMINIPLIANLLAIGDRRQHLVNENLRRINAKRIDHSYSVGDWVKFVEYNPDKLDYRHMGHTEL